MKTKLLILFLITTSLSACKKLYKADPQYPDLPAYSELGLNVGGILINDKAWLTVKTRLFYRTPPCQLLSYPAGDSIVFMLNGNFKDSTLWDPNLIHLFIVIKNIKITTDNDLLQLNNRSFILDGNTNYGGFSDYFGSNKRGNATGTITFGKVSVISNITYGDGSPNNPILHPYIIAGHLDMTLFTTTNYALTHGRFDVTVLRSDNFIVF